MQTTTRPHSFTRYLASKKALDDRSLNRHVYGVLARHFARHSLTNTLRILDLGAGIGTMLTRLLEWGLIINAEYTALDADPETLAGIETYLEDWAKSWDYRFESIHTHAFRLLRGQQKIHIQLIDRDLQTFLSSSTEATWDLVLAHTFLDLVDLPEVLPGILALLDAEGLGYFTHNFDGVTIFEPAIDPEFEESIERLYHQSMDQRRIDGRPAGDSRTGRHLFTVLRQAGAEILAAGGSDWVVYPQQGNYSVEEAYFLAYILNTVEEALAGHPDLDRSRFTAWMNRRRQQLEAGELVYIAHQIDFLVSRRMD